MDNVERIFGNRVTCGYRLQHRVGFIPILMAVGDEYLEAACWIG